MESPILPARHGAYADLWHRFTGKPETTKLGTKIKTKCGKEIYDHWNVSLRYNPRIHNPCIGCYPGGKKEVHAELDATADDGHESTPDVGSSEVTGEAQRGDTGGSEVITSTPEPIVSETPDVGDGNTSPEQGSGVQRTEDDGHVEELPEGGETGSTSVEGGTSKEGGQGKQVREPSPRPPQRPAPERKSQGHPNR